MSDDSFYTYRVVRTRHTDNERNLSFWTYTIFDAHRELPLGWEDTGKTGSKDECLSYAKEAQEKAFEEMANQARAE